MTALADNKEIAEKGAEKIAHPVVAADIIYRGAMVKHNAAGYLAPCASEAGAKFAGIAYEYKDNSGGSAGDVVCKVIKKGLFNLLGAGFSQATVGDKVYASDDATLTLTYAAGLQWVGVIVAHISATQAWVKIDEAADGDVASLGDVARVWRGDYTFAATATGSYDIGDTLPDNAIITKSWYDVQTTVAGDGDDSSTIAITSGESANDLVTAVAIKTGTPYDAGIQACIPVGTAATMVKTTSAVQPQVVVSVQSTDTNVVSGALSLFIEYVVSL